MADTFVKNPKLIVGTQSQVEAEMGANDIGFATDVEFYTKAEVDELLEMSGGASLPVLMPIWSDHVINNMSWLRADTFSWQSGDVYKAAYEHLTADFASVPGTQYYAWLRYGSQSYYTTVSSPSSGDKIYYKNASGDMIQFSMVLEGDSQTIYNADGDEFTRDSSKDEIVPQKQTDTIGDITITYCLSDDGHKICLPDQESNIVALYENTGAADYYLLDTTNKQFKLPRKQKRTLIQAVKNDDGTWYNLYSDGWVEQGGHTESIDGAGFISLPIEMAGGYKTGYSATANAWVASNKERTVQLLNSSTATSLGVLTNSGFEVAWTVRGYASESAFPNKPVRLEYYYVGNFEQSAIEQTAGITAETLNNKADIDLANISNDGRGNIAGVGMPSDQYVSLSLGASDSSYVMPADGWLCLKKAATGAHQYIGASAEGEIYNAQSIATTSGQDVSVLMPVRKGMTVYISYSAAGGVRFFNFIYAEGSKHLS